MLNSLCNHQQQPRVWKINCTLAKGKGNCFARYTTKSCLQAIHLSDVCKKKISSQFSPFKSRGGLLWTVHKSRNKEMSKRVRGNLISMPKTETARTGSRQLRCGRSPPEGSKTTLSADSKTVVQTEVQGHKLVSYIMSLYNWSTIAKAEYYI